MELLIKKLNILVTLMLQISSVIFAQSIENKDSLELVVILHRHGHRTPTHTYKNDPYKDEDKYWPIGLDQLTNKGKMQMYNLGKLFREEYKTFISSYSVKAVQVNSTNYKRSHMSAQCLLAGWFPPSGSEIWNEQLIWQPIPIHSVPIDKDQTLALRAPCPRFWCERQNVLMHIADNETPEDKKLFKYLTTKSGENISTIDDLATLYSTLKKEELNGLTLPDWTINVFPHKMQRLADLCANSFTWNEILKRFFSGPLIKETLFQLKEKSEGRNKDKKLFIYTVHELVLFSFLRTLNFENIKYGEFGAAIVLELHRIHHRYFVKLLYSHSAGVAPYELTIPQCSTPCSLDKILSNTEYYRSVDWDKQCFE
ncbi:lysosomal acid phosphatase-like [Lycorma delicatula]|uniref:lysosomal acid phosphatase-like n=1 Tax=Lycorma delicatula TaxID=130591 RepID=UPI003F515825